MLPLFVDMTGIEVVVFGGGAVGRRKANFLAREAHVTVVALDLVDGFDERVDLVRADIGEQLPHLMERADLVVAATDDRGLNDAIAREARNRSVLCNRADGLSTFLIPSVVERDTYAVAISTGGRSPAMARYLRLKLERELDGRYDRMVRFQEDLREDAKCRLPSQAEREEFLRDVLDDQIIWDLLESDTEAARARAMARMAGRQ